MTRAEHRPCERQCATCKRWQHTSRFHCIKSSNGTVGKIYFEKDCRACQQRKRNELKNADRPLAIIHGRAQEAARKAGATTEFFMVQMNYQSRVEPFRALMGPRATCQNCGHGFINERDIQLDHKDPPRHNQDWEYLHARNLEFLCASCNNTKGSKPFAVWRKEQEDARLSNLEFQAEPMGVSDQLSLF